MGVIVSIFVTLPRPSDVISPRAPSAVDTVLTMDFGFSRYDLNTLTRRIELPEVSPDPAKPLTLIVRAATTGNHDFGNALFRYFNEKKLAEPPPPPGDTPPSRVDPPPAIVPFAPFDPADAARAAELYAGTAIVGWENATVNGEQVPFTHEAAVELLIQLITHVPDVWRTRVRDFVDDVKNFRSSSVDPVDLGKG